MSENNDEIIKVVRPFGPSVAKIKMPKKLISALNNYVEEIISDDAKSKSLNHGNMLAGNVTQEFKLENEFIFSSGFHNFLG
jgi:hypothetical protein